VPVKLVWTANTDEAHFRQNATIHTNDPLRPTINLTIQGQVTDASSYHPKAFFFGDVPAGSAQSAEIRIVSFRDEPFEVVDNQFVTPALEENFTVEIDELTQDEYPDPDVRSGYRVKLTTRPTLPFGPIGGWLKIKTNLDTVPEVEVPLSGKVVSDFSIVGRGYNQKNDLLELGPVVGEVGTERELLIFLRGEQGKAAQLEVGQTFPKFLEAELGERKEISENLVQVPLVIRVPKGASPAVYLGGRDSQAGRVVIRTTHPHVPELTINVKFTIE
jgi:hypothetical protein